VQRSLADEIVIPMSSRMNVDMRNVQRLEKDYMKQCTQQVELINKTEKEIEKWQKKVHCWLGLLSPRPDFWPGVRTLLSTQMPLHLSEGWE